MGTKFFFKYKHLIVYGFSLAVLLLLLQFLEYRLIIISHSFELYITAIAILFTVPSIWLARKLIRPKIITQLDTVVEEKEIIKTVTGNAPISIDTAAIEKLGLSSRAVEVLQLMAEGWSNAEIAERLFISLNTVKTHSARLFENLDVKRRTQAVEKAKRMNLIG